MSLFATVQTGCLIAFAVLLLLAAWQDWRTMQIADGISLGIAALFIPWALTGVAAGTFSLLDLALALACAAGMFGLGTLAFAAGAMGGGDVKLAAAASLFAGPGLMVDFVTVTALVGGLLGVAILAGAPIGPRRVDRRRHGAGAPARQPSIRPGDRRGRPVGRPGARPDVTQSGGAP